MSEAHSCILCSVGARPNADQITRAEQMIAVGLSVHDLAHLLAIIDEARN